MGNDGRIGSDSREAIGHLNSLTHKRNKSRERHEEVTKSRCKLECDLCFELRNIKKIFSTFESFLKVFPKPKNYFFSTAQFYSPGRKAPAS